MCDVCSLGWHHPNSLATSAWRIVTLRLDYSAIENIAGSADTIVHHLTSEADRCQQWMESKISYHILHYIFVDFWYVENLSVDPTHNRRHIDHGYAPVYSLDGTVMVERKLKLNPQVYIWNINISTGISLYTLWFWLLLDPVIICGHPWHLLQQVCLSVSEVSAITWGQHQRVIDYRRPPVMYKVWFHTFWVMQK